MGLRIPLTFKDFTRARDQNQYAISVIHNHCWLEGCLIRLRVYSTDVAKTNWKWTCDHCEVTFEGGPCKEKCEMAA